jgi:hypothetical protein
MHAVLQYTLNILNKSIYRYKGSGTVYISGTANVIFKPNVGEVVVKFGINEWVYDLEHHIWQIKSIYGTPEKIYYVAFNGQYEQVFTEDQLVSFEDGYRYFSQVYDQQIASYAATIEQIDEKINNTPDVESTPGNIIFKFQINEYVYDANNNKWQVVAIENDIDTVIYVVRDPASNILANFPENSLFSVESAALYFDEDYQKQIDLLEDQIEYIDGLIADTPNIPATPSNLVVKYDLNEFVYDSNKNIWQIIAVENTVDAIQYLAKRADQIKLFDQDSLYDYVGETPYFLSTYEEAIASYAEKIAAIEAIITEKFR